MNGIYFEIRGKNGRYYCDVNDDAIHKWIDVPPAHKLRWLEEANYFLAKATDKRTRKPCEKFKGGGKQRYDRSLGP